MKEKTFEELISEYHNECESQSGVKYEFVETDDVLKLMQQVREATIAEVLNLADDNLFNKEPKVKLMGQIEEMKTDRIKLTENK